MDGNPAIVACSVREGLRQLIPKLDGTRNKNLHHEIIITQNHTKRKPHEMSKIFTLGTLLFNPYSTPMTHVYIRIVSLPLALPISVVFDFYNVKVRINDAWYVPMLCDHQIIYAGSCMTTVCIRNDVWCTNIVMYIVCDVVYSSMVYSYVSISRIFSVR